MWVLHADDETSWQGIVERYLKERGHSVTTVSDGEEILTLLGSGASFDLVITDNGMLRIPGLEVLRQIRADPNLKKLPVFILTGDYIKEAVEEAGGVYIDKPKMFTQLDAELSKLKPPAA